MFDEGLWAYIFEDKIVELGAKEGTLLLLLIENKNRVVTFEEISQKLYGYNYDDYIGSCIRQIKSTICEKTQNTIKIYNKRNVGYMLKGR